MVSIASNLQESFGDTTEAAAATNSNEPMNENSSEFIHGYSSNQESSSSQTSSEEPNKKANSLVWVVLIILIIALVALVSYYFGFSGLFDSVLGKKNNDQVVPKPIAVSTPTPGFYNTEDKQYSDPEGKFSLTYSNGLELNSYEDGTVSLTLWGPTQKEGTEFYDGVSLNFKKGSLGGKTLKDFVDGKYNDFKEVFETTMPLLETVAEKNGYKFQVKGYVEADYYYVELSGGEYLEIIDATKDPTNKGFAKIVEQVMASLKVL